VALANLRYINALNNNNNNNNNNVYDTYTTGRTIFLQIHTVMHRIVLENETTFIAPAKIGSRRDVLFSVANCRQNSTAIKFR